MCADCLVMADTGSEVDSDVAKNVQNAEYDPKLDFLSEHFDPIKALATPGLLPPVRNAKMYDNLAMFEAAQHRNRSERKQPAQAGTSNTNVIIGERRWLPHQLPITKERKSIVKNVFTRMEAIQGPLSLLKKCKDERIRIKVWTRHSHGIRGYCTAFVVLFDRHWNMVLEDVTEIWTRPKRRKVPPTIDEVSTKTNRNRLVPPPIKVIKSDKKTETCERHVDQLLVRGEHIVVVITLP